jgi:hypothetical protein
MKIVRSEKDTPEDEGIQLKEYLWHDRASGFVFFHNYYSD